MICDKKDFDFLCSLIKEKSGIALSEEKAYLLESRLMPLVKKYELENLEGLVSRVKRANDEEIITSIIEAMTTNETSFFRDNKPFMQLKKHVIPRIVEHNKMKRMKIWSAACSTGQEPYSLAMTLLEEKNKMPGFNFNITATDIDKTILSKANEGVYSQFEVQRGLPVQLLIKYFAQQESYGEKWCIKDEVKSMINFKYLNLLDSFPIEKYDVILCRNVLIYFEPEVKSMILNKLADRLEPHGLLFLGSSETIMNLTDKLEMFEGIMGLYQLKK